MSPLVFVVAKWIGALFVICVVVIVPGGREVIGSDLTMSQLDVVPPILAASHCAVSFASAIEATVHREIDISVVRSHSKCTNRASSLFAWI